MNETKCKVTSKDTSSQSLLMGNEAMGRGLVEQGVTLAASYPGTPASEILAAVVAFAKEEDVHLHAEWSVNEKVARWPPMPGEALLARRTMAAAFQRTSRRIRFSISSSPGKGGSCSGLMVLM